MVILLGFKVFVDFRHVGHDLLPIRSLNVGHFHYALKLHNSRQTRTREFFWRTHQSSRNSNALGSREGDGKVFPLVSGHEFVVGDKIGQVGMHEGAQCQAVVPRA